MLVVQTALQERVKIANGRQFFLAHLHRHELASTRHQKHSPRFRTTPSRDLQPWPNPNPPAGPSFTLPLVAVSTTARSSRSTTTPSSAPIWRRGGVLLPITTNVTTPCRKSSWSVSNRAAYWSERSAAAAMASAPFCSGWCATWPSVLNGHTASGANVLRRTIGTCKPCPTTTPARRTPSIALGHGIVPRGGPTPGTTSAVQRPASVSPGGVVAAAVPGKPADSRHRPPLGLRRRTVTSRVRQGAWQEFKAALLEVVAFHYPGSAAEVERECANLLACLG